MHKVLRTLRNIEIFHSVEEADRSIATESEAGPSLAGRTPYG
jgi:hypothetical protein